MSRKPFIIELRAKQGSVAHQIFGKWSKWKGYETEARREQAFEVLVRKSGEYFEYRKKEC